jgi:hypothetical protein
MHTAAQILARHRATSRIRRYFRHGGTFVRDPLAHSTPLDRNERAKLIFLAERLERRTKEKGRRNGALGNVGLEVLRALLFKFADRKSGLCFPSYLALQMLTGRCRGAIAAAICRLEHAGIIKVTRRLKRVWIDRRSPITGLPEHIQVTVQDSNLYAFSSQDALDRRLDGFVERYSASRPRQIDILARLLRRMEAESTGQAGESYF